MPLDIFQIITNDFLLSHSGLVRSVMAMAMGMDMVDGAADGSVDGDGAADSGVDGADMDMADMVTADTDIMANESYLN
jgi:hypothetical protein